MPTANIARLNPYVGPRSFQRGEQFYGRTKETLDLLDLLIAERIVLLYSPSGAGKTSLIQAALVPALEAEGFFVHPPVRVSALPPTAEAANLTGNQRAAEVAAAGRSTNRYILSLILSLEEALPVEQQRPLAQLVDLTLEEYLDTRAAAETEAAYELFIFDQFEEIISLDGSDIAAKEEFFDQVGTLLGAHQRRTHGHARVTSGSTRWALFAMREEFVAALDPYLRAIPTRLSNTYRLELLGTAAALEAIQQPAQAMQVEFTVPAAQRLIDDLRVVRITDAQGNPQSMIGPHVEPVQLQVVCRRLWDKLLFDATTIEESDVDALGDIDKALRDYYADAVAAVAAATAIRERVIRDWIEERLMTEQHLRNQVMQGVDASAGLANDAIRQLVDTHLVRAENRRSATWFELAHDRLIGPVLDDNREWRDANLSALQRQAALWQRENRPDGLILQDEALRAAEAWAADHEDELESQEREFLDVCRAARRAAEIERRMFIAVTTLACVAVVAALIALVFYDQKKTSEVVAVTQRNRAQKNESLWWASRSFLQLEVDPVASLNLAAIALPAVGAERAYVPDAELALVQAVRSSLERAYITVSTDPITPEKVAMPQIMAPDALALVAGDAIRTVNLTLTTLITVATEITPVDKIQWINGNSTFITYNNRGQVVRLWQDNAVVAHAAFAEPVACLAAHPGGGKVAICSGDRVWLWDGTDEATALITEEPFAGPVLEARWSPDGQWLAAWDGNPDNTLVIWEGATGQVRWCQPQAHSGSIKAAWIEDAAGRAQLVTVGMDQQLIFWPTTTAQPQQVVSLDATIENVMAIGAGRFMTWGGRDVTRLWDLDRQLAAYGETRDQTQTVQVSPDQRELLTISARESAQLWPITMTVALTATQVFTTPLATFVHPGARILTAAWHPSGAYLATAGTDGVVKVWQDRAASEPPTVLHGHRSIDSEPTRIDIFGLYWMDEQHLITYGEDGSFRKWLVLDAWGQPIHCRSTRPDITWPVCEQGVQKVQVGDPRGGRMIDVQWVTTTTIGAVDYDGIASRVTPATGAIHTILPTTIEPTNCAEADWHPDGSYLLFFSKPQTRCAPTPAEVRTADGALYATTAQTVTYAAWINDQLLARQGDGQLLLYASPALTSAIVLDIVTATITAVAGGNDHLALGLETGEVRLWDLHDRATPQLITNTLPSATRAVRALHWVGNDSELLLVRGITVTLWSLAAEQVRFAQPLLGLTDAVLTADGRTLALAADLRVVVYDVASGEQLWEDRAATQSIRGLRWIEGARWPHQSEDETTGNMAVSAARLLLMVWDGSGVVRLWDWENRGLIDLMPGPFGVNSAVVSPDGTMIATGMDKGSLQFWPVWQRRPAALQAMACGLITRSLSASQAAEFSVPGTLIGRCS